MAGGRWTGRVKTRRGGWTWKYTGNVIGGLEYSRKLIPDEA